LPPLIFYIFLCDLKLNLCDNFFCYFFILKIRLNIGFKNFGDLTTTILMFYFASQIFCFLLLYFILLYYFIFDVLFTSWVYLLCFFISQTP
jgi:hypothetical protein